MNNKIYLVKTEPSGSTYYATRANMQGVRRNQIPANHISVHDGIPHVTLGHAHKGLRPGDTWMTSVRGIPITPQQEQKYNNLKRRYETYYLKINQHPNTYQNLAAIMPPPGGGGLFGAPAPAPAPANVHTRARYYAITKGLLHHEPTQNGGGRFKRHHSHPWATYNSSGIVRNVDGGVFNSFKKGGKISKAGLYKLHKGEVVVPAHRVKTVDKALRKSGRKPLKKVCKNCVLTKKQLTARRVSSTRARR